MGVLSSGLEKYKWWKYKAIENPTMIYIIGII